MWVIARVDYESDVLPRGPGLFGIIWGHRFKDMSFEEARASGFVRPTDDLVLVRPNGTIKAIDEGVR